MDSPLPPAPHGIGTWHAAVQGSALLVLSIFLVALVEVADMPAAFLIGPMIAGIIAGTNGATIRVPKQVFGSAQAVVGCLISASISIDILTTIADGWLLIATVVLATLAASSFLGWAVSRFRTLPGTTAVWGSAPGGATAMVLMADAFGADARLVAFMQYLRVIIVSVAAAAIARLWVDTGDSALNEHIWFPAMDWVAFATTLAVVAVGGYLGRICRLPSPYFLGAVILGGVLHIGLDLPMQLPEWLLALSYMAIGWAIGLNFTSSILRHAFRALPLIVCSILLLMAFCGSLAWLLSHELGIDPLTAYLATSPGGIDSVVIIAAASKDVDISFVVALQTCRLLFVLALGPSIARLVSRWVRN